MLDSDYVSLVLVLLAVWWIAASFAVMTDATRRGYSGGTWFFAGLFLNPMFAILLLLVFPAKSEVDDVEAEAIDRLSISPRP